MLLVGSFANRAPRAMVDHVPADQRPGMEPSGRCTDPTKCRAHLVGLLVASAATKRSYIDLRFSPGVLGFGHERLAYALRKKS